MSTLHLSDSLLDGYVALFRQLPPKDQTILLDALTKMAGTKTSGSLIEGEDYYYLPSPPGSPSLEELAGSWIDDRSAEEIIADLRRSRTPNIEGVNL